MTTVEVGLVARGRIAWILAIACGLVAVLSGAAIAAAKSWSWSHSVAGWLVGVGSAFAVVGAIFLIASYATGGRSD